MKSYAKALPSMEYVEAAVAYVTDTDTLIKGCFDFNVRLTIWARYAYTQPVAVPVLEKFLSKRSPNFSFYFVPDIFHPKVIWWHGYGAYIGSANLTKSAWSGNIEAGLFFTEDELSDHNLSDALTEFFLEGPQVGVASKDSIKRIVLFACLARIAPAREAFWRDLTLEFR